MLLFVECVKKTTTSVSQFQITVRRMITQQLHKNNTSSQVLLNINLVSPSSVCLGESVHPSIFLTAFMCMQTAHTEKHLADLLREMSLSFFYSNTSW